MAHMTRHVLAGMVVAFAATACLAETPKSAPTSAGAGDLYVRISDAYLQGKWDVLEKELRATPAEFAAMTPEQKADVAYVKLVLAECRPAWWAQTKAGTKGTIKPVIWGRTLNLTFDPALKNSVESKMVNGELAYTVSWKTADMDNPEHAEHGFSKGDLTNLGVWSTLGMAGAWGAIPLQSMVNLSQKDNDRILRYLDFRGNLAGIYYGTPQARRWGLWLYLAAYMEKYAKMPTAESRKAVGSMFLVEVVGNPAKYPSLKLPATLADDGPEAALADYYKGKIEKQRWTIAEDKTLREAIRACAIANEKGTLESQKVTLPDGLFHILTTEDDAPFRAKREAWLKAHFEKAGK